MSQRKVRRRGGSVPQDVILPIAHNLFLLLSIHLYLTSPSTSLLNMSKMKGKSQNPEKRIF